MVRGGEGENKFKIDENSTGIVKKNCNSSPCLITHCGGLSDTTQFDAQIGIQPLSFFVEKCFAVFEFLILNDGS